MVPTLSIRTRSVHAWLCAVALLFAVVSGCRSVGDIVDPGASTVHTTIAGRIVDPAGNGMAGVTITSGSQSATTDAKGVFFLPNVLTSADHAFVIAKKSGYFNGARTAQPNAGGVTYMQLRMVPEVAAGTIDASTGGAVTLAGGAKLSLTAGSVQTSSGSAYTGPVTVYAAHLDPTDAKFASEFPGDLSAQAADGKSTILRSFGVMLAELRGTNGEVLQPTSSNPARLTVPVAASLLPSAKSTIPLWYYDETIGLWKEEGSATLTGNAFVGDVKHFTAWNCDYSGPWGTLHGRVVCGGEPAPGVVVSFGALVAGGMPVVTTEQNGEFTIKVPANWDKLEYQIIAGNNMGLYYTNAPVHVIVATGETKELGDITLDSPCPSYLDGVIRDCDGKPTPGMVVARWSAGGLAYTYTVDGHYRMIVTPGNDVTLAATSADGHAAEPVSVHTGTSGQDINAPDLIACQETSESFIDIKGTYGYTELVFSPDGSKLAVQQGKDVVLYGAPSWSEVTRISTMSIRDSIRMPVFSKDGSKILLSASNGMQMEVYNVDGTKISTKSLPILTGVFSDDGSSVIGILKGSLVTYDLLGNQLSSVPLTAQDAYQILGRAADGSLVVPAYEHTYLLDPTTGAVKSDFPTSLYAWGMKVSANGHILGGWSSALHFYTLATGAEITPSAGLISNYAPFDIAPDDLSFVQALSTAGLTTLGFFTMADGTPKHLLEVDQSAGSPGAVAVTADGKHVAAVYQNGIRIWTLK